MPATSNNMTLQVYGSNTPNRVPDIGTLRPREFFVNTHNSYNIATLTIANGGSGYDATDIGRTGTITLSGITIIVAVEVIITAVTNGEVTGLGIVNYGQYESIPAVLTGPLVVNGASGSGAQVTVAFFVNPRTETGGGLFVGDATDTNEVVQVTGSLGAQDHDMVNITGGNISNVTLTNVSLTSGAQAPTTLQMPTLISPMLEGGTINGATITGGSLGTSSSFIPDAYIQNLRIENKTFPVGVTGVGVLMLGSDGIVYVTPNPTVSSLTSNTYVQAGAIGVGVPGSSVPAGAIRATGDITAFIPPP